jgi:hypothetical protein
VLLAQVKEAVACSSAAVWGEKDGLGAVEDGLGDDVATCEGPGELVGVVLHRGAGGGTHEAVAVEGADDEGLGALQIRLEIAPLVGLVAIVKVRPVGKDLDAQAREVGEAAGELVAPEGANGERHAETWAVHSARL